MTLYQVFRRPVPADIVAQNLANIPIPVRYSFIYDARGFAPILCGTLRPATITTFRFAEVRGVEGGLVARTAASTKRAAFI